MPRKKIRPCKVCGTPTEGLQQMGGARICSLKCFQTKKRLPEKTVDIGHRKASPRRFQRSKPLKICNNSSNLGVQRTKLDRDSQYLKFVASLGCMICRKPAIAHHTETGGIGVKGSDYSCINLCDNHHVSGQYAVHRIGVESFEEHFNIDIKDQQIQLLRQYLRCLGNSNQAK